MFAYVSTDSTLTVTAEMVAGDAAASVQALYDTLRGKLEGVQKVVINAPLNDDPVPVPVPFDGAKTNAGAPPTDGKALDAGLYVDFWYVGIGDTYYAGDGTYDATDGWKVDPLAAPVNPGDPDYSKGQTYFANLEAFIAHLESLPIVESASIVDGNIVIIASRSGKLEVTLEIYNNAAVPAGDAYINTGDLAGTLDASLSDADWKVLVSDVELGVGDAAGTLTLTSKDKVSERLVIKEATLDTEGTLQVATASFTDTEAAYYEGGKVGVTVNGETIEVDMLPTIPGEGYTLTIAGTKPFALTDSVDYFGVESSGTYSNFVINLDLKNAADEIAGIYALALVHLPTDDDATVSELLDAIRSFSFYRNGGGSGPDSFTVAELAESVGLNAQGEIEIVFKDTPITIDGVALTPKFQNPALNFSVNDGDSIATLPGMTGLDDMYIAATPDINGAELTLNALKAEIEYRIANAAEGSELKKIDSVAVEYNDTTGQYDLKLTAKEAAFGKEIDLSKSQMTIEAVTQVSKVDLTGVTFETRDSSTGPAQVSLEIAGHTVTADVGIDSADTVRNLAQAVIDARDGVLATHVATVAESGSGLVFDFGTSAALTDTLDADVIRGSIQIDRAGTDNDETVAIEFTPTLKTTADTATSTLQDFVDYLIKDPSGVLFGKVESVSIINGNLVILPKADETLGAAGLAPKLLVAPLEETVAPASQVSAEYSSEVIAAFESRMDDSFYADLELVFMKDGSPTTLQIYMKHDWEKMDVGLKIGSAATTWSAYAYPDLANVDSLSDLVAALNWLMQQDGALVDGKPLGEVTMVGNTVIFSAAEGYVVDVAAAAGDGFMFQAGVYNADPNLANQLELFMGGFTSSNPSVLYKNAAPSDVTWTGTETTGTYVTFDFKSAVSFDTAISADAVTGMVTVQGVDIAISYTPPASGATLADFRDYLLGDAAKPGPLYDKVESISIVEGNLVIQAKAGETLGTTIALTGVFPVYADKALSTEVASDTGVTELDPSEGGKISTVAKVSAVMAPFDGAPTAEDEYVGYDISMKVNGEVVTAKNLVGLSGQSIDTVAELAAKLNTVAAFAGKVVFADDAGKLSISTVTTGEAATLEVTKLAISSIDFLGTASVSNVKVTGADYVAPEAASVTLAAFAGLTGTEVLTAGSYDYVLQVNGLVKSGTLVSDGTDTVADYVAAVQATVGAGNATVTLAADGLLIETIDQSAAASVEVASGGFHFHYGQQVPVAAVADVLDSVVMDGATAFKLTAQEGGSDPLDLKDLAHETALASASHAQVIDIQLVNSTLDNATATPAGTVVSVTLKAGDTEMTSSVTLSSTQSGESGGVTYVNVNGLTTTRAEAVAAALKAKLAADWGATLESVHQGVLNPLTGEFVESTGLNSTTLRLTSAARELLPIAEYSAAVTVGATPLANAVIVELQHSGDLAYGSTPLDAISNVVAGRDEGLLVTRSVGFGSDIDFSINGKVNNSLITEFMEENPSKQLIDWLAFDNFATPGVDNLPAQQITTNPGETGGESFYGDAAGTVDQTKTNPDDTEANEALYGAAEGTITDGKLYTDHQDGRPFVALPAEVAFELPPGTTWNTVFRELNVKFWISDADDRGVSNWASGGEGKTLLEFLNAASAPAWLGDKIDGAEIRDNKLYLRSKATGDDAFLEIEMLSLQDYDWNTVYSYTTSPGNELIGRGSVADYFVDTRVDVDSGGGSGALGEAGSEETRFNLGDDEDHDYWSEKPGFVPFDETGHKVDVLSAGNSGADVVKNFQTSHDKIVIEGELAASTIAGQLDQVDGGIEIVDVDINVRNVYGFGYLSSVPTEDMDLTKPFTLASAFSVEAGTYAYPNGRPYKWTAPAGQYDSLEDLESALNANKTGTVLDISVSLDDADIMIPANGGQGYYSDQTYPQSVLFTVSGLSEYVYGGPASISGKQNSVAEFDLDSAEFGLITSADNASSAVVVNAKDVGDVSKVADLLNSLFDFDADNDDEALNTSIFAVTAADDPSKTAIWAHQQSTAGDDTVDAIELNLLAVVNTVGAEFSLANLACKDENQIG